MSMPVEPDVARIKALREILNPERLLRVVDVGANPLVPPPYATLLEAEGCEVHGFEPQPEAYDQLVRDAGPLEHYYPNAVGKGGPAKLNLYPSTGLASFYDIYQPAIDYHGAWRGVSKKSGEIHFDTVRMDDVEGLPPQDLLKIDVQGAELEVIDSGEQTLEDAVAIVTEVQFLRLYEGQPLAGDIDVALRAKGYMLHRYLFQKYRPVKSSRHSALVLKKNRSQILDGDAVYIRDLTKPDEYDDARLVRLAIAADAIFGSPDLVLKILDHLVYRGSLPKDAPDHYVEALPRGIRMVVKQEDA